MMAHVRLAYVHSFRDRHGKLRHYFRRPGFRQIPLPGVAYESALAGIDVSPRQIGAKRTKPGSISAALVGYYQSAQFLSLGPNTQAQRRTVLERFREKAGDWSIATLPRSYVANDLAKKRPAAQRNWLKALRSLIAFAIEAGMRSDDPTAGITLVKYKTRNRRAWTNAEVAAFEATHAIGSKARLAFALGLYTGQRLGDVIRMGPQHIRNGVLHLRQGKTDTELQLPIASELQAVLDATPTAHLTFLVTRSDRPYTQTVFSHEFRKWCNAAGLPKDLSLHGLRATVATRLAEAGASTHMIASITGHATLREIERYTKAAEQKRLAAQAMELQRKN